MRLRRCRTIGTWTERAWYHSSISAAVALVSLGACAVPPPPLLPPQPALSPRDSAALAYDTGRRDAQALYRPRTTSILTAIALPLGLAISRATDEYWAVPITAGTVTLSGTVWAYREMRRPLPVAPDSMRTRYGLEDPFVWRGYQRGFQDVIEVQRREEFKRSAKVSAFVVLVTGLTYYAFQPKH